MEENPAKTILEEDQRFSRSHLWRLQRRFFEERTARAWSEGVVPHYVTNNPFLARAYGRVLTGFLRDGQSRIDPAQPVYVVELGAGSGRLGYHLLKQSSKGFRLPAFRDTRIKYVMTDFSPGQVEELSRNPFLRPLVEEGVLDFAVFDAEAPGPLRLVHGGEVLAPGSVFNPLGIIANYFFDSVPQDVFLISEGELHDALVTLTSPQEEPDPDDPEILGRVDLEFGYAPAAPEPYGEAAFNRILEGYRQSLDATHVLFPCAALRCLDFFRKMSGGRLLVLSADKGYVHEEALLNRGLPGLSIHGSFSLSVNFHAIAQFFRNEGGTALHAKRRHASLRICAFATSGEEELPETRHAFEEALEVQGPDDFYTLKKALEESGATLSVDQILAFLRFSGWDAGIFAVVFPRLMELLPSLDELARKELGRAARQIWETYLPIGEDRDLAFELGVLLSEIERLPEALEFFGHSLRLQGPDAATYYNLGICYARLRQFGPAFRAVEEALAREPNYPEARSLRIQLLAESEDAAAPPHIGSSAVGP
jgi:tetratricopeptide (TPR) repeat protein